MFIPPSAAPKANINEVNANGSHVISDDLDETAKKKKLLRQKHQMSMEDRHNQTLVQNLVHDEFRRQISEVYDLSEGVSLGAGGFGKVQTVVHKQSGTKYALKVVELSRVKDAKSLDFFFKEVDMMRQLDHPNICRLHAVYSTVEHLFMVMDLCKGGDLLTTYHFKSEQEAANIMMKVTNAVRYMHDRSIAHRDLKLDNILMDSTKEGADVKLVDFGLSAHFTDFQLEHDVVGTWVYMAPEVISGNHFPRTCDMWGIGVIAYLLLCGYPPFGGSSTAELKDMIQHGTYQFHHEAWSSISNKAKNFIKRLLVRNPQERMSALEAQHHPWLNQKSLGTGEQKLSKAALSNLVTFRQTSNLKRLALELVARSLNSEQIRRLEQDFLKMDKDGSGTISFEEFESVLASQADLSREELRALFNSMDVDNGKELNFNEFLAATLERRKLDKRRLRLAFDRLDFDHSGTIDANDLKLIVGSDMGQEAIDKIFKEFDLNQDGEIDFNEFTTAMLKADPPVVRLATYRPSSMPHINASQSIKNLKKTIADADQAGEDTSLNTSTTSGGETESDAVMRASLARCASKMMEDGALRNTVPEPVTKRPMVLFTKKGVGGSSRQFRAGPSRLAHLISSQRSSTGTMGATKIEVDAWEARPMYVEEEPEPWGEKVVTAATGVQKQLQ